MCQLSELIHPSKIHIVWPDGAFFEEFSILVKLANFLVWYVNKSGIALQNIAKMEKEHQSQRWSCCRGVV